MEDVTSDGVEVLGCCGGRRRRNEEWSIHLGGVWVLGCDSDSELAMAKNSRLEVEDASCCK